MYIASQLLRAEHMEAPKKLEYTNISTSRTTSDSSNRRQDTLQNTLSHPESNMHELIPHPRLKIYISHVKGTLTLDLTGSGKPPKTFEYKEYDFDVSDDSASEFNKKL